MAHRVVTSDVPCLVCGDNRLVKIRTTSYENEPGWYRCRGCASECLRPQPSDARLSEIYSDAYYAPWEWEAASVVQRTKAKTLGGLLRVAQPRPGHRLLDVGCAQGEFAAEAVALGLRVSGVDLNPKAIAAARRRVPDATFYCGSIDEVPDDNFDLITMFDFLEHVRCPIDTLQQASARLHRDGHLLISTPRVGSVEHRLTRRAWPQYREEHLNLLSLNGIRRALDAAGMVLLSSMPTTKYTTMNYLMGQLSQYGPPKARACVARLRPLSSLAMFHRVIPGRFGEMTVLAQRHA